MKQTLEWTEIQREQLLDRLDILRLDNTRLKDRVEELVRQGKGLRSNSRWSSPHVFMTVVLPSLVHKSFCFIDDLPHHEPLTNGRVPRIFTILTARGGVDGSIEN